MGVLIANLLQIIVLVVTLLVLARVVLSWFDPAGRSAAASFVTTATEPILGPIRRTLPPTGAIDLSPLIVLIVLGVVWRVI